MFDESDYIKKGNHKYFKAVCNTCGKDRGYQRLSSVIRNCLSCATKKRLSDPKNNPMYGKKHKNTAQFRKDTYSNVDYSDTKIRYSKNGNKCITYKQRCPICNKSVGYRRHIDAKRTCRACQSDKLRKYSKEHKRIRYSMKANLHSRLKQHLINKNKKSTFDILGYTVNDLKIHLESLWEPWMSWDNYGAYCSYKRTWQIDHIKPDSLFNYESITDPEFKECWSLSNLQPLDSFKNLKKGNKYNKSV